MEPHKAGRPAKTLMAVGVLILVAAGLAFWAYRSLQATRLGSFVRADLPMLDLRLQFKDTRGETIAPSHTRLGAGEERRPDVPDCPEMVGGDTRQGTTLSDLKDRREDCPRVATWHVTRHPIGLSLYFQDAESLFSLLEGNAEVRKILESRLFRGLFHDALRSASVRAEDLHLEGMEGALLDKLIREAVAARGELHYDIAHGKKGFVFSFVRSLCPTASKVLPVMAGVLARSGYRAAGLREPVLEMRIGLQRLFLTQQDDRVYMANGLEALINVLESLRPPAKDLPRTPLALVVRGEAFVDRLIPVMIGPAVWEMDLGLGTSVAAPGSMRLQGGRYTKQLRPKIFKGVLGGIPHDAFATIATSYHLPAEMTNEDWKRIATRGPGDRVEDGPGEAGVAIIWDLASSKGQISDMGVVIASQTSTGAAGQFARYFTSPALTAQCGGGTVFLAATSRPLLQRMRESCEGQSLSVLDWERGARRKELESSQLLFFMNPGVGLREIFLAGGAGSGKDDGAFETKWTQEYGKAKEAMRRDAEAVFREIPIFAYAGNMATPTAEAIELKGFAVKQPTGSK